MEGAVCVTSPGWWGGDNLSLARQISAGGPRAPSPAPTPGTWNDPPWTPPPFPSFLLLAEFSFPAPVLTFVLEI